MDIWTTTEEVSVKYRVERVLGQQVDYLGFQVAPPAEGSPLTLGTLLENSSATPIGELQTDHAAQDAGAAHVLQRSMENGL
jgi:hypothetical protein